MKIALMPNAEKDKAIENAHRIIDILSYYGTDFTMHSDLSGCFSHDNISFYGNHSEAVANSDLVIAVGGDGTIIHMAKHAAEYNKPVLGVNCGRIGFVANLEPAQLNLLPDLLTGEYPIDERMLFEVDIEQNGTHEALYALNDVTVTRGSLSTMVELDVMLNGEFINSYRADGIILATPTGSTAYSLSAGGPVIEPHMKCILLTPICPHSLFSRSILFSDDSLVSIRPHQGYSKEIYATIDGIRSFKIEKEDSVTVRKSEQTVRFIKLTNKNFYRILSDKLNERRQ